MTDNKDIDVNEFLHYAIIDLILRIMVIGEVLERESEKNGHKKDKKHKLPKRLERGWE